MFLCLKSSYLSSNKVKNCKKNCIFAKETKLHTSKMLVYLAVPSPWLKLEPSPSFTSSQNKQVILGDKKKIIETIISKGYWENSCTSIFIKDIWVRTNRIRTWYCGTLILFTVWYFVFLIYYIYMYTCQFVNPNNFIWAPFGLMPIIANLKP